MSYAAIRIQPFNGNWPNRAKQWERLKGRLPGVESKFLLGKLLFAYLEREQSAIDECVARWEAGAPRPDQRIQVLSDPEDDEPNIVAFGGLSGTGKTCSLMERVWREAVGRDGLVREPNNDLPLLLSGHEFARRVAAESLTLNALMDELIGADYLILDDLDKRGDAKGRLSRATQQALLDLMDRRTVLDRPTLISMNSDAAGFEAKLDDEFAPFIMRRLEQRFRCVNFDVEAPSASIIPLRSKEASS